jgi:hypothetical protein
MMKAAPVHHFVVGPRRVAQSPGSSPPICVCIELRFLSPGITRFGRCCEPLHHPRCPACPSPASGWSSLADARWVFGVACAFLVYMRSPLPWRSAGRTFAHSPRWQAAVRKPERRPLVVDILLTWRRQGEVGRAQRTSVDDVTGIVDQTIRDRQAKMGRVPKLGMLGRERREDFANRRVWAAPRTIAAILALHSPCLAAPTIREPAWRSRERV